MSEDQETNVVMIRYPLMDRLMEFNTVALINFWIAVQLYGGTMPMAIVLAGVLPCDRRRRHDGEVDVA